MPVKRPCIVQGCPNYVEPQGMSDRQLGNANRCPTHQRNHDRAYDRVRNARPARRERANPIYQTIPKPIGLRCALRIEHVCTGWATTWDAITPYASGGSHVLSNLQPACRECNSSKGAR
jgi:5-methylcytosine-specific restriction endonuclease McrA